MKLTTSTLTPKALRPVLRERVQWPTGTDDRVFWKTGGDAWCNGDFVVVIYIAATHIEPMRPALFELATGGVIEHPARYTVPGVDSYPMTLECLAPHPELAPIATFLEHNAKNERKRLDEEIYRLNASLVSLESTIDAREPTTQARRAMQGSLDRVSELLNTIEHLEHHARRLRGAQ